MTFLSLEPFLFAFLPPYSMPVCARVFSYPSCGDLKKKAQRAQIRHPPSPESRARRRLASPIDSVAFRVARVHGMKSKKHRCGCGKRIAGDSRLTRWFTLIGKSIYFPQKDMPKSLRVPKPASLPCTVRGVWGIPRHQGFAEELGGLEVCQRPTNPTLRPSWHFNHVASCTRPAEPGWSEKSAGEKAILSVGCG